LGDHNSEPVACNDEISFVQIASKRDNESSDDESSDNELLSVKDILEEFLGSKPKVIDLTFDSEFEVSRPSLIKARRLLRGLD
jgi:hypothetical protein